MSKGKLNELAEDVLRFVRQDYAGMYSVSPPRWIQQSSWRPPICLRRGRDRRIVAVDIIPSGTIPRALYREQVLPLLDKHRDLRVIVCAYEQEPEKSERIELFCASHGIGLKTIIPRFGLQTIVPTDLDPAKKGPIPTEAGWFPREILLSARGLTNLSFASVLDEFISEVQLHPDDEAKTHALVTTTIGKLLAGHPECHANIANFIRLLNFEKLLRGHSPQSSEHTFHSFRVFLAGCCIINQFYEVFRKAYERLCLNTAEQFSLEYCWLLTAIFHDIGRQKEALGQFLQLTYEDPYTEFTPSGKDTRWLEAHYERARQALTSLGVFIAATPGHRGMWDGGLVPDKRCIERGKALTNLYDSYRSHAVLSAFDMLAEVFDKASAIEEIENRPFVVAHAVPAALAIFLHDWHIWPQVEEWQLYPIDMAALPLAAVLVYLDTWDDYKRKGRDPMIHIDKYQVTRTGATVVVQWANDAQFEREKAPIKYSKLKEAIKNRVCGLQINGYVVSEP